jgi:hypothetical protein
LHTITFYDFIWSQSKRKIIREREVVFKENDRIAVVKEYSRYFDWLKWHSEITGCAIGLAALIIICKNIIGCFRRIDCKYRLKT